MGKSGTAQRTIHTEQCQIGEPGPQKLNAMQISHDLLIAYGGTTKKVEKGGHLFWEGDQPLFFFQLLQGEVRVFSTNSDGKELTQGIFISGDSFGEPPLLLGRPYPSTAVCRKASVVIRISRDRFFNILHDNPDVQSRLLLTFANRIYSKAAAARAWIGPTPEDKILGFLDRVKQNPIFGTNTLVPYTRQQIADFTGLRVETVIRTLVRMSHEGKVTITDRKLYY